ncbi:MAG: hypothetical protein H7Y59_02450 [Anaerolineales bacterium]|nr:hypothetical protein [Anaerolineales bacterium]
MNTRQAIILMTCASLLILFSACSTPNEIVPTQTVIPPTPTATRSATFTPSPVPPTFTPTPLTCLTEAGEVKQDVVSTTNPPQEFLIYVPPCYDESDSARYPVLYLLHGQTYTDDQWVRLGVPTIADRLIQSEEALPFVIVFPDDRYWNLQAGSGFGDRLINYLIPYVDMNYLTLADREHRALGGLSRGGGWTIQLGFTYPELFGSLGLHSPAIFKADAFYIEKMIKNITEESRPQLWLDVGDVDRELESVILFEDTLSSNNYIHKFHLFAGDHTENYWGEHVEEYLRWYAQAWQVQPVEQ